MHESSVISLPMLAPPPLKVAQRWWPFLSLYLSFPLSVFHSWPQWGVVHVKSWTFEPLPALVWSRTPRHIEDPFTWICL